MLAAHMNPEIVVSVEAMRAQLHKTRDVAARFLGVAVARERGQRGHTRRGCGRVRMLSSSISIAGEAETGAAFGFGVLIAQVGGADVFFQCELAAVALAAAVVGPAGYLFRGREVGFAADETFLALVDGADVDG